MTTKSPNTATVELQRHDGGGWVAYAGSKSLRRPEQDGSIHFVIGWVADIRRGDRVLEKDGKAWEIFSIFRVSSTADRPNLILQCRWASEG